MLIGSSPIGTVGYLGGLQSLPEEFCWCWGELRDYNRELLCGPGKHVHYDRATLSLHDVARNNLVQSMLGDWLFQLDTDIQFEPDCLMRMLQLMKKYDVDVIAGIYVTKKPPRVPLVYKWVNDGFRVCGGWSKEVELIRCDGAGGGALLVKRSVFDRIYQEFGTLPFTRCKDFGEDLSFFWRLKQLDIHVYAATKIEFRHMGTYGFGLDDLNVEEELGFGENIPTEGFV